jgi:hypothetical protein
MEMRSIGIDLGQDNLSSCSTRPKGRGACAQEVYARNSSRPGALNSTEGRIYLRRLALALTFLLRPSGGPYITSRWT